MKKVLSFLLILAMLFPAAAGAESADPLPAAAGPKDDGNTTLGTSGISNPALPEDRNSAWSGSYVYFGTYNGSPIRFRVLAKDSTAYTAGKALFLDSDAALFEDCLDDTPPYSNAWDGSSLQEKLNGAFLEGLEAPERAAIAVSTGSGGCVYEPGSFPAGACGAPISVHDQVFLLDPAEVMNEAYGYFPAGDHGAVRSRKKKSRTGCWMLRTAAAESSESDLFHVLAVIYDGGFYTKNASEVGVYSGGAGIGVAPAMNLDQESILFASSLGTDTGEFKLTLVDSRLSVTVPDGMKVSMDGTAVTVPYEIGGPGAGPATRASVLILDREYDPGNPNGASILYYRALDADGGFALPAGCSPEGWGTDYHVYVLAENLSDPYRTDYASAPVSLNVPGSLPAAGESRISAMLPDPETVPAAVPKDGSNTTLGTSGISNPVPYTPGEVDARWSGNCVYFGAWDGSPIRFRVLAKDSTAYTSGKALFLDSDTSLFNSCFDNTEPYTGIWADSDLRVFLNGAFLEGFDEPEQAAVALSTGNGRRPRAPDSPEALAYGEPVSVSDRVFLPDAADVTNPEYGYSPDRGWNLPFIPRDGNTSGRIKGGSFNYWWLRSASAGDAGRAGDINCAGILNTISVNCRIGVAPVLNVDQEHILFATAAGAGEGEFKLTLIDSNLSVSIPDGARVSADGTAVTVPYVIGGPDAGPATRASVLILSREYTPGNTNGAAILYYVALEDGGAFTLPAGCGPDNWGTDYWVYLLAENVNGPCETDYASVPFPVERP